MTEAEVIRETAEHMMNVRRFMGKVIRGLILRMADHDTSKLSSPEFETFVEFTPKLRGCTYGSDEYKQFLEAMKPALDHHYAENRHHPEYYQNGIQGMTLVDLLEMFCDWCAAVLRHADGDIVRSIEQNQKRFGYSDDLKHILMNSAQDWE